MRADGVVDLRLRYGLAVLEQLTRGDVSGALAARTHLVQTFAIHPAMWRRHRQAMLALAVAARARAEDLALAGADKQLAKHLVQGLEQCIARNEPPRARAGSGTGRANPLGIQNPSRGGGLPQGGAPRDVRGLTKIRVIASPHASGRPVEPSDG
jgi:hypothetical protein